MKNKKIVDKKKIDKPFGEWRIPIAVLVFSSLIFISVTLLFGIEINRFTGETVYQIEFDDGMKDPWVYDPMTEVWGSFWRYWCILGYFCSLGIFSLFWFEYEKWKWLNIPKKERYEEVKVHNSKR